MRGTDEFSNSVEEPLPNIAAVEAGEGLSVSVTWSETTQLNTRVDLAPDIFTFRTYAPLRDNPELFRTVHVINSGSALGWGSDDGIDMPSTAVERLASEVMSTLNFQAFLKRTNLTRDAAAAQFGISRRLVGYYASGQPIPRYIALACSYLESRSAA